MAETSPDTAMSIHLVELVSLGRKEKKSFVLFICGCTNTIHNYIFKLGLKFHTRARVGFLLVLKLILFIYLWALVGSWRRKTHKWQVTIGAIVQVDSDRHCLCADTLWTYSFCLLPASIFMSYQLQALCPFSKILYYAVKHAQTFFFHFNRIENYLFISAA